MKRFLTTVLLLAYGVAFAQNDARSIVRQKTEKELAEIASSVRGVLGFVAIDLERGDRFSANEGLQFPQASAIKIAILMEVFKQADEGKISLTAAVMVEKEMQVGGSGVLQHFGDRQSQLSVYDLCVLMIQQSDNTATNMLIDVVGMKNVNATLRSLGLKQTVLQRRMMDQSASARGDENLSSPAEAARIMQMLYKGEFISRAVCDGILSILKKEKPGRGLAQSAVPEGTAVAYKPGGIAGVQTEWAIVYLPNAEYVLVMMGNYAVGEEYDAAMRALARVAFEYFSRTGSATRYGTYVPQELHK